MSNSQSLNSYSAPDKSTSLLYAGIGSLVAAQMRKANILRKNSVVGARASGLAMAFAAPQKGNCEEAANYYRGIFNFAGHEVKSGPEGVFEVVDQPEGWAVELRSFDWLNHLQSSNRELSRVHARALILNWIEQKPDRSLRKINEKAQSRRVISWVRHAGFVLEGASEYFARRFYQSLTRQVRSLAALSYSRRSATERLASSIALAYGVLGLKGMEKLTGFALARLSGELEAQIYADGGHISRNPQILAELMNDLLPVREALEEARIEVPAGISGALERMFPMLRFLSHGDGGLAVFNGVSNLHHGLVRHLFDKDNICGRPLSHAVHSGYVRMQQGKILVLMDVGKPPLPIVNPLATMGPLAFEFSDEGNRVVVNCGSTPANGEKWAMAARSTQAHSTLSLDDQPAGRVFDNAIISALFNGQVVTGAKDIICDVTRSAQGSLTCARHDAYAKSFGIEYERQLFIDKNGRDFRGQDSFIPVMDRADKIDAKPFALRFHLHPAIKASLTNDGKSVLLVLSNKSGWRFSAKGAQIVLEESIFMPVNGAPRKSTQIVLRGTTGATDRVNWAFKRVETARKTRSASTESEPMLL